MATFGFVASALLLALWVAATVFLVRSAGAEDSARGRLVRRLAVLALCLAAAVGGFWGPTIHRTVDGRQGNGSTGPVAETVRSFVRTPAMTLSRTVDLDARGEVIRDVRMRGYQIPLSLLALLGWAGWKSARTSRRRAAAQLLILGLLGPGAGCAAELTSMDRAERHLIEAHWDTLVVLESLPEDTVLFGHLRVAADSFGIRVLDGLGHRVALVGWDGVVRWYAGRRGSGPGELLGPRALGIDGEGTTWVLDIENFRITGFDVEGRRIDEVPLFDIEFIPHEFAVAPSGDRFYVLNLEGGILPVEIRRDGRARRGRRVRFPGSAGASMLALQGDVRAVPGSDRWVFALSFGDGLFRFDGLDAAGAVTPYVEQVSLATVEERVEGSRAEGAESRTRWIVNPTFASRGLAVAEGRILVAFGGESPLRNRLLDIYGEADGSYRGSLVLPFSGSLAAWDDVVVLSRDTPHPHLMVLRPSFWP